MIRSIAVRGGAIALCGCALVGCATGPAPTEPSAIEPLTSSEPPQLLVASSQFEVIPAEIECGVVSQCQSPAPLCVVLRNGTSEPIRIRGFVATCGCTIPDLQPNTTIPPLGEVQVRIRLELWGQGRKQQFIRFVGESGQPIGRVRIQYEVRSTLRTTPSGISRDLNPDGSFLIESTARVPFAFTSSTPAVVIARSADKSTEQGGQIDWAAIDSLAAVTPQAEGLTLDASGRWSTLLVRLATDCQECPELFLWVKNSAPVRTSTP